MRSTRRAGAGQEALWEGPAAPGGVTLQPGERGPRRGGAVGAGAGGVGTGAGAPWTWSLEGRAFARRGWHAGTLLHVIPASRADRGTLVVVREGDRSLVGFLGLDRGRPALLDDTGATWLSDRARVVGVVTAVEAPLTLT